MRIGEAAEQSQVSAKAIRFYEDIGLLSPARRRPNGYRDFSSADIGVLRLIRRARNVGFTIGECQNLVSLLFFPDAGSSSQKRKLEIWLAKLDEKERDLDGLSRLIVGTLHSGT